MSERDFRPEGMWWPCLHCSRDVRLNSYGTGWIHDRQISDPPSHEAEPDMPTEMTPEQLEEWLRG